MKFLTRGGTVHRNKYGCYHPNPDENCWTIVDNRGYIDRGSACDECGLCDCACPECGAPPDDYHGGGCCDAGAIYDDEEGCIGLSFFFLCLDGGESLCEDCAEKVGLEIMECTCP